MIAEGIEVKNELAKSAKDPYKSSHQFTMEISDSRVKHFKDFSTVPSIDKIR